MSNDDSPQVPAPRRRRDAVREKAQQVQVQQSRTRLIRGVSLGVVGIAVIAVAAVVVGWAFASTGSKPTLQPANVSDDGFSVTTVDGVALGVNTTSAPDVGATPTPTASAAAEPSATPDPSPTDPPPVEIRVYIDYLSPTSADFQTANVQQLAKWVTEDAATLTYYPVAMLTAKSNGTKYSLRAASAAACVATHSSDAFFAFNNALLSQQPEIDSDGLTDTELADLAIASGAIAPKSVRGCIEQEQFTPWAKNATDRALQSLPDTDNLALTGTPTVLVNGTPYVGALDDPKEFAQFVLTVASDAYYTTPSPTPPTTPAPTTTVSPTPTPSS